MLPVGRRWSGRRWSRLKSAFAEDSSRIPLQYELQREPDEKDPQVRCLDRPLRRQSGRQYFGGRPDRPDQDRAEDRTSIVPASSNDKHNPDQERSRYRLGRIRLDKFYVMRHQRAAQPHEGGAEDEGFDAKLLHILPGGTRRVLVLTDSGHHSSPRGAASPFEQDIEHQYDREHEQQHPDLVPWLRHVLERLRGSWRFRGPRWSPKSRS